MAIWSRKIREAKERTERVANDADRHEQEFRIRAERVKRATTRAERAAIALMTSDDELMRSVARGRR